MQCTLYRANVDVGYVIVVFVVTPELHRILPFDGNAFE